MPAYMNPPTHLARRRARDRIGGNRHAAGQRVRERRVEADREAILLLAQPRLVLDAQAVVQGQLRAHAPVVLHVAAEVAQVAVERRRDRHAAQAVAGARVALRIAEQEAGEGVPDTGHAAVAAVTPLTVGSHEVMPRSKLNWPEPWPGISEIDAGLAVVGADLQRVAADETRVAAVERRRVPVASRSAQSPRACGRSGCSR